MIKWLYDQLKSPLKRLTNHYYVTKINPTCEINSFHVSRESRLGKNLKIRRNVQISRRVSIGDNTRVNANTIIQTGDIGRYCSIGYNCVIGGPNHPLSEFTTSNAIILDKQTEDLFAFDPYAQPPIIGHDVWIASKVVVLQGVRIGNGAVIGAGSIVTKDVEAGWIYAGVPAKKIRKRTDDSKLAEKLSADWFLEDKQTLFDKILS
jgi:virginiamycin A acetyltransferase